MFGSFLTGPPREADQGGKGGFGVRHTVPVFFTKRICVQQCVVTEYVPILFQKATGSCRNILQIPQSGSFAIYEILNQIK
jgi:hypothetical protein